MKQIKRKRGFLRMLLGTLGASLLGNLLAGKGVVRAGYGSQGEETIKVDYESKGPPHPLTNFEIQKYYQNENRFNEVYSTDNLHDKIRDGAYVRNLDEHSDIGTHWIALYILNNKVTYFDSFGVEHIPEQIKNFIKESVDKFTFVTIIFRIQAYNPVICGCFCIGFIDFILKGKS